MTPRDLVLTARKTIISWRLLFVVVIALGLCRGILVFLLPDIYDRFDGDEMTFAELTEWIAQGNDFRRWGRLGTYDQQPWGVSLYPATRALILPGVVLTQLGLSGIESLRLTAIVYSTLTGVILVSLARWARGRVGQEPGLILLSWPLLGLALFLFLPVHLVYNSVGSKQAPVEFWATASVASSAVLLYGSKSLARHVLSCAAVVASIAMMYQTRAYMATILVGAIFVGAVLRSPRRVKPSASLAFALLIGTTLGLALAGPSPVHNPSPGSSTQSPATTPSTMDSPQTRVFGAVPTTLPASLPQEAPFALRAPICDRETLDPKCELLRLPAASLAVMFRPLPIIDQPSDSDSRWLQIMRIDSAIWIVLSCLLVVVSLRRWSLMPAVSATAWIYCIGLIVGTALFQRWEHGAVYYKASIVWAVGIIFLLSFRLKNFKDEQVEALTRAEEAW